MLFDEAGNIAARQRSTVPQNFFSGPLPPSYLVETLSDLFVKSPFQMPGGNPPDYFIRSDINRDDRPRCNDGSIPDGDSAKYHGFARSKRRSR